MTADTLGTMFQIAIPFALFGLVLIGGASSTVARWLGRGRRPFRSRKGIRPPIAAANAHAVAAPMSIMPAPAAARPPQDSMERDHTGARRAA